MEKRREGKEKVEERKERVGRKKVYRKTGRKG